MVNDGRWLLIWSYSVRVPVITRLDSFVGFNQKCQSEVTAYKNSP